MKVRFVGGSLDGEECDSPDAGSPLLNIPVARAEKIKPVDEALTDAVRSLNGEYTCPHYDIESYSLNGKEGDALIYTYAHTQLFLDQEENGDGINE